MRYGEGLFMGYRGFEHRCIEPRYPFGHGLSYTTFEFGEPALSSDSFSAGTLLRITIDLHNSGDRAGSEVVQCYVAPDAPRLARPNKELKGFAKVHLAAGGSTQVVHRARPTAPLPTGTRVNRIGTRCPGGSPPFRRRWRRTTGGPQAGRSTLVLTAYWLAGRRPTSSPSAASRSCREARGSG